MVLGEVQLVLHVAAEEFDLLSLTCGRAALLGLHVAVGHLLRALAGSEECREVVLVLDGRST